MKNKIVEAPNLVLEEGQRQGVLSYERLLDGNFHRNEHLNLVWETIFKLKAI